jgi:hypothetical protein
MSKDQQFLYFLCGGSDEIIQTVKDWCEDNDCVRSSIFEERIAKATELINRGNDLFKENKTAEAKAHYLAAGYHADFDMAQQMDLLPEHKIQIRSVLIRILLNVSNNALKMKEFNFAKLACSIGLDLCKTDQNCPPDTIAKFHYRRARAQVDLRQYDEAVSDSRKAMELLPADSAVRDVFVKASMEARKAKEEADAVWRTKKMFGPSEDEETNESYPHVDLVLTDKEGKPILTSPPPGRRMTSRIPESRKSLIELICCKRKPKSA